MLSLYEENQKKALDEASKFMKSGTLERVRENIQKIRKNYMVKSLLKLYDLYSEIISSNIYDTVNQNKREVEYGLANKFVNILDDFFRVSRKNMRGCRKFKQSVIISDKRSL